MDDAYARLTLVYDFVEGGQLLRMVHDTVEFGTTILGKGDLILSDISGGTGAPRVYHGCFAVRYEQFTGFGQDIKLKERVVIDCDYVDP